MTMTLILNKPVIAVTGSAGKTTTKEMLAAILQRRWKIYKTKFSLNAYWISSLSARRIKASHRAAVLEFGMGARGNIQKHCEYVQPNIGVITNVGTAHIGHVGGTVQAVANVKSELIQNMKQTGFLVLNADDANSRLLKTEGFRGTIVDVGIDKPATYRASNIRYSQRGMKFQCKISGRTYTFFIPTYGVHNVYNALNAIAVARKLGFPIADIKAGLRSYQKPKRRLTVNRLKNGVTVIDDSFSANTAAVKAAVDVLCKIGGNRKIVVLGPMLAMGRCTKAAHREVGHYLANKNIDALYTLGEPAKHIAAAACQSGFPSSRVKSFLTQEALRRHIAHDLKKVTTLLFKASHDINLSQTVDWVKSHVRSKNP